MQPSPTWFYRSLLQLLLLAVTAVNPCHAQPAPAAGPASTDPNHAEQMKAGLQVFKQDVRQILVARCIKCHSGERQEGELDLASRDSLLKGGSTGPAVIPGKHQLSRLFQLASRTDDDKMPQEGAALSKRHLSALAKWIDLGAPYDGSLGPVELDSIAWTKRTIEPLQRNYWAYQPLKRPPIPPSSAPAWSRNPIDHFILKQHSTHQLKPQPQASTPDLVRRAYFDLVGLPPKPEIVRRLADARDENAYEQLIDDLLDSPQYGERWARHWLDVARFAESHGFEHDYDRKHAYHYRDFVIRALNQDMAYDQFIRWQLAGDELAPDNPLALMATGFLGAGVFPTQITANEVERTRYDALDDMLATTGTAMLGLTIGCARCHDHKFDPIPQADYYRLLATFTTTVRSDIDLDLDPAATARAKKDFAARHQPLVDRLASYEARDLPAKFQAWEQKRSPTKPTAPGWLLVDFKEARSKGGATFKRLPDGSLLATGINPDFDTYTFIAETNVPSITGFRLEALAHPSMVKAGPGRAVNGNFDLTNITLDSQSLEPGSKPVRVALVNPRATFEQRSLLIAYALDKNPKSGWAVDPQFGKDHAAGFTFASPIANPNGLRLIFTLTFNGNNRHNIGRPRISLSRSGTPLPLKGNGVPAMIPQLLAKAVSQRNETEVTTLLHWYRTMDPGWQQLQKAVTDHLASQPKPRITKVQVCTEGAKPMRHHSQGADFFKETYFLARGETDQKRGAATQGFLQVLMRSPEGAKTWKSSPPESSPLSYRRTSLANWITDVDRGAGHLLARTIVNRLWQHHFQQGIVRTVNDFGKQGTPPTHPALLDWLASELIANEWKLKPIHKLIMTSATYRQSSAFQHNAATRDPENQYLWHYPARRLEAEAIRDAMLAVSGQLDSTMYGPGTLDPAQKRRSVYFMVKRSKLIPMMQLFDAPEPLSSVGARPTTTIAPQALLFMNNPQVRGYAQAFAARLEPMARESLVVAVTEAYWLALGRPPNSDERADSVEFLAQQSKLRNPANPEASRVQALTDFCQVLFSMNEFIYIR
ncbi:MAG: PSD1 and planctomycete cytochrome C domain-containing protein [Pirellulaceae bacterium]